MSRRQEGEDADRLANQEQGAEAAGPVLIEAFDDEIGRLCEDRTKPAYPARQAERKPAARHEQRRTPAPSRREQFTFPVEPRTVLVLQRPRTVVNHSYRDFSCVPAELTDKIPTEISDMTFSQKVHHILSQEEFSPYIGWMPHGRSFRCHVPKLFERLVSQKYFGHTRYSSFLCQLNNHGFKHITKGVDRNSFYHQCFLRGMPHLCKYMPKPKNSRRQIPDPQNEPDFYVISREFPLPDDSSAGAAALDSSSSEQTRLDEERKPAASLASPANAQLMQALPSLSQEIRRAQVSQLAAGSNAATLHSRSLLPLASSGLAHHLALQRLMQVQDLHRRQIQDLHRRQIQDMYCRHALFQSIVQGNGLFSAMAEPQGCQQLQSYSLATRNGRDGRDSHNANQTDSRGRPDDK